MAFDFEVLTENLVDKRKNSKKKKKKTMFFECFITDKRTL